MFPLNVSYNSSNINKKTTTTTIFIEHLLSSRHSAKHFMWTTPFNSHYPNRVDFPSTHKETEA